MALKPHVQLDSKQQRENPIKLVFNYGNPNDEDEPVGKAHKPDLTQTAVRFRTYLTKYENDQEIRINERNQNLGVSEHFEYIRITFLGQFNVQKYFQPWINDCGLMGVEFSKFNHEILFAVVNRDRFDTFLDNIDNFVKKESGENDNLNYIGKIRYIKSFKLFSTGDIIRHDNDTGLLNVKLVEFPLDYKERQIIVGDLREYLLERGLEFVEGDTNLELYNASVDQALEIAKNFDIVLSVTSGMATVIRPDILNLPERSYGFEISNSDEDLPIIGILDTGISNLTPLASILLDDTEFNLTGSPVYVDNIDGGQGHGTGVAALAALGRNAYRLNYIGEIPSDAKLLSMKILDDNYGYISQSAVISVLTAAKAKYPDLKVFVLTICFSQHKLINENPSHYAFELDKFAHENDCLICICTANNPDACNVNATYNLSYFDQECTNICSPAESMNNIIVGAASHSLKVGAHRGVSTALEFPPLYTRKSHIDLSSLYPVTKINKRFFRPDVIEYGGDYEFGPGGQFFGQDVNASMDVLSADPTESFYSGLGTSFSAPLVANIAARIQKRYPGIRTQSIKALIVNGASTDKIRFESHHQPLLNKIVGHGLVDDGKSLDSEDNRITFLIEDEIEPEKLAVFPLHFPEYLVEDNLGKTNGLLKISATLCFSFRPVMDNQMVYCPIHMAFSFFKNHSPNQILTRNEDLDSLLKSSMSWSQNGRYRAKPVAPTNTQKISFVVNKQELIDENGTFKIGINCRILSQLLPNLANSYDHAHPFSMVITIEENVPVGRLTGKLYNDIIGVNQVININEAEGDLEAEA